MQVTEIESAGVVCRDPVSGKLQSEGNPTSQPPPSAEEILDDARNPKTETETAAFNKWHGNWKETLMDQAQKPPKMTMEEAMMCTEYSDKRCF